MGNSPSDTHLAGAVGPTLPTTSEPASGFSSILSRLSPSPETRRHINYIIRAYPQIHVPQSGPSSSSFVGASLAIRGAAFAPLEIPVLEREEDSQESESFHSVEGTAEAVDVALELEHGAIKRGFTTPSVVGLEYIEETGVSKKEKSLSFTVFGWQITMTRPNSLTDEASTLRDGGAEEKVDNVQHSEQQEESINPDDLDFDGPDDERNAKNWPLWERIYGTVLPSIACFIVSFGASVYAPAVFSIQRQFGVTLTQALAGVTLYVLGMGFGPISETIGRRAVYCTSLPIAGVFSLGVAYANNFATILVCRFFSAMFGAGVLAVGAGSVADIWDLRGDGSAVYASCLFLAMAFMGPSYGPLVGFNVIADGRHWRWTMFIMCMLILVFMFFIFFARETYRKAILLAQARRDKRQIKKPPPKESLKLLFTITLFRPVRMIFVEPIVCFVSLYNGFCFAVFFAFFESLPFVFSRVYKSSERGIGNAFLSIWIGVVLASISCGLFERFVYQPRRIHRIEQGLPDIRPEERLYAALLGSILFPAGLFIWAWTARENISIVVPLIGCILFGWGTVATFIVTATYMVQIYNDLLGASALGANSLVRYGMGAAFPLFTVQMYDRLGIQHAGTVLASIAVALGPIPWVLFFYGDWLRNRSVFIRESKGEATHVGQEDGRQGADVCLTTA
ncbi:hypothetical protein Dda_5178 [Drechslerella dactyloides]|uniref:Major facilitator superfamily (MFS) profile domain-containing protein n=1 Tax=Drechslerella dactyloides TaxID=74499 RepID=A0AAD6NHA6_DREDA|nr:hypothetical protein Dda_5178 [Drechslerella dactyloides]